MNIKISESSKRTKIRILKNAVVACAAVLFLIVPYHFLSGLGKGDKVVFDSEISEDAYDISTG